MNSVAQTFQMAESIALIDRSYVAIMESAKLIPEESSSALYRAELSVIVSLLVRLSLSADFKDKSILSCSLIFLPVDKYLTEGGATVACGHDERVFREM